MQPLPPSPSPQVPGAVLICRNPALIALALPGIVPDQALEPAGICFLVALGGGLLRGAPGAPFSWQCLPLHQGGRAWEPQEL